MKPIADPHKGTRFPNPFSRYPHYGDVHWALYADKSNDGALRTRLHAALDEVKQAVNPGSTVLDVGCGDGVFLSLLQEMGYTAHGIDDDLAAYGMAVGHGLSATPMSVYDCRIAGKWGLVTMTDVIEHLTHPVHALRNLAHVTTKIVLTTPVYVSKLDISPFHAMEFREGSLRGVAQSSGWTVDRYRTIPMPDDREDIVATLCKM